VDVGVGADVDGGVGVAGIGVEAHKRLHSGVLRGSGDELYIELDAASARQSGWAASGMESPPRSYVSSA
jgi:hypothetical protein